MERELNKKSKSVLAICILYLFLYACVVVYYYVPTLDNYNLIILLVFIIMY